MTLRSSATRIAISSESNAIVEFSFRKIPELAVEQTIHLIQHEHSAFHERLHRLYPHNLVSKIGEFFDADIEMFFLASPFKFTRHDRLSTVHLEPKPHEMESTVISKNQLDRIVGLDPGNIREDMIETPSFALSRAIITIAV